MPDDHAGADVIIDDVGTAIGRASTAVGACQAALDTLARHTEAMTATLLRIHDHLRCVAAAGSWQVFSTVAPGSGVVGRVYTTATTSIVTDVTADPDYISLGPLAEVEICAPIPGPIRPVGALNVEFAKPVDTATWRYIIEAIARQLGIRITDLGGPPVESSNEKLVRHGLYLTTAETEIELAAYSLYAAHDVSGLDTPVLILGTVDGYEIIIDEHEPTPLARLIAAVPMELLIELIQRTHKHGAAYTLGDPADHNAAGFEALTAIGVRSLITIPVGAHSPLGGILLIGDERPIRPAAETVALIGLLAAQAWSSRERIRTLANLHERALSDPLTGLRHQGSFGERLAGEPAGQTAIFAIDIDGFKAINDTYGHQAGDRALVALAQALSTALRTEDELYRIGGDEFAAIAPVRRAEEAVKVAERLLVAARAVGHTISVGVALRRPGELPEDTIARADSALYLAKRGGRDAVRLSP